MSDLDQRIAQFENMAREDPENDMAHFSLAGAYAQAGRHADAAESYLRCIELNPAMTKASQLAGAALLESGERDRAIQVLKEGCQAAAERGDLMPRDAMARMLEDLGEEPPAVDASEQPAPGSASGATFVCARTGQPGTQLPNPPFRGPVGQWIFENIAAETWRAWIGQGTKVINELKLDLSREEDQATYDEHMYEFLGIDENVLNSLKQAQ